MAMSVNRRIGRNLLLAIGHLDPESMIRAQSTDPIRASGLVPRRKAGHMTAIDPTQREREKILASRGPSTHGEDDEHRTFPGVSTLAFWAAVG